MTSHLSGLIIIDKPAGPTSFQVVRRVKQLLKVKKAGHLGTLDPFATGVLPLALGEGTKLIPYLDDDIKTYRATLRLGLETDTQDLTGQVTATCSLLPSPAAITDAAATLVGEQEQVPPMYSAVHFQGQRLYHLARQGKTVAVPPRRIVIRDLTIEAIALPDVTLTVTCSKGTYIRTLAADLGRRLGCGAHLQALTRLAVGPFTLSQAVPLPEGSDPRGRDRLLAGIRPLEDCLPHLPAAVVEAEAARRLRHGQLCPLALVRGAAPRPSATLVRVMCDRQLVAICHLDHDAVPAALVPRRVFMDLSVPNLAAPASRPAPDSWPAVPKEKS